MKMRPNDRLVDLVDVATGQRSISELGELSTDEKRRLTQLREVLRAFSIHTESAPTSVVESAKAILPIKPLQIFKARLGRISLATVGARFETADQFQATFQTDKHEIRMSFERTTLGWSVMGKLPPGIWTVAAGKIAVESEEDGRFELMVDDIAAIEWRMKSLFEEIEVPSLSKVVPGDSA